MTRFILHVNRRSQAWTHFEALNATELLESMQSELKKLGFEACRWEFGNETTWVFRIHHSGHAPEQWSFAIQLLSIGYNFVNHQEREKCHVGESAFLEMFV